MTRIAINLMLRGRFEHTLALCERAEAVADRFGLEEIRAHILNTRGVTRVNHGDLGGSADLDESIGLSERLNSAEAMIRGYKNYGSTLMDLGELRRAAELEQRGVDVSRRFGADFHLMWFETELGILAYWAGEWDAADAAFGHLDAWIASVGPHYMEAAAHSCRAKLRSARGDVESGTRDIEGALEFARRSREPQSLLPTLADAAVIAATGGRRDAPERVAELFDEAVEAVDTDVSGASSWLAEFALALALTGQAGRFSAMERIEGPWRWLSTARLVADGRYFEAADDFAAIGARPEEALARLLAARSRIDGGDRAGGDAALRRAVDFWESVGCGRLHRAGRGAQGEVGLTAGNTEPAASVSRSVHGGAETPTTTIEVWADIVCSWCYVGKRHLETALEAFPEGSVELRWRSFELDPTIPADAGSADEELARRRGLTLAEARAMHEETEQMGADIGIHFDFASARRGNTFDAHRVLHMAHAEGRQVEVMDRLLAAYFGEGEPIGDRAALARVAGGAGLDPAAVGAMLAGDDYAADVRGDEREAAALGITAVPFFVIDRRFGLSGAHPAESLRAAIEQARTS